MRKLTISVSSQLAQKARYDYQRPSSPATDYRASVAQVMHTRL